MNADNHGFPINIPFLQWLGVRCLKVAHGEGIVELPLEARHMNSWEMAHGGVTMTLDMSKSTVASQAQPEAKTP